MLRFLGLVLLLLLGMPEAFAVSGKQEGNRQPNRLLKAASPYLRQHAYNPVDWFEWGDEAFDKAKMEGKPIFLSIGYSTCHWCHVMERESFEDDRIAEILNTGFVSIKVDRERHPDVDETYMLATQLITGQGGWPNSVFLTPDRKPFYAGTYFPPQAFLSVLSQVTGYWAQQRQALVEDAEKMALTINGIMTRRVEAQEITPVVLHTMSAALLRDRDEVYGGFGSAPKFPQEAVLLFLLRLAEKDGDKEALDAVTATLHAMLNGGITDQAGGGFHRYAVDRKWLVPHFEKMLYNQALITQALLRAYALTGEKRFAAAARRALDYVLGDLTDPKGGFYSARDADSEGEEGTFYVWTEVQIDEALDTADAAFAKKIFGVTLEGNFENGTTVLNFARLPKQIAENIGMKPEEFDARVEAVAARLAEARAKREPPHRDEKIVSAWNGMMIEAFAEAALVLGEQRYEDAAARAAAFIWEEMQSGGKLKRTWFEGKASLDGAQEDYAFVALSFIALSDQTGKRIWLERAEQLVATMVADFRDDKAGDFFMTASASTFSRAKSRTDAGTPSGNAAALEAFARLLQRTSAPSHQVDGEALLAALSGVALQSPYSNAYFLMSADMFLRGGAGPRQFLSRGAVHANASLDEDRTRLRVVVTMADRWHINSNRPKEDFLIATELTVDGAGVTKVSYPRPVMRKLGFHDKKLALYEGKVEIAAELSSAPAESVTARLRVQACSDEICLQPETAELRIPVPPR